MTFKILVCGLPTSGKTTLSTQLQKLIQNYFKTCDYLNGDDIRKAANDWDFSVEGRLRQADRFAEFASKATTDFVIMDFVCPLQEMREKVNADWIIWMDTIDESKYDDTNKMFIKPSKYDFRITEKDSDKWSCFVCDFILNNKRRPIFNNRSPTAQMLGRWQPWHLGHLKLFEKAFEKTGQVVIMVRDCKGYENKNPFDFEFVKNRIERALEPLYQGQFIIILVPNITNITYGRDVGYTITQEDLGADIHKISATQIRKEMLIE